MQDAQQRAQMVSQHLEGRLDEMLALLRRFVEHESGSRDKADVDQMGEVYRSVLEPMGFSTEVIEQPETGNHYIFRRAGDGKNRVLILAHLDTVWPRGTLEWWPFKVEGERATGPGVADMKGGIVIAMTAIQAVLELGLTLPGTTTIFFIGDEELGSPTAKEHVERLGREHDRVLVVEPSNLESAVLIERGGIGAWKIEVTGKSAHTVAGPGIGASAIHALAYKIVEIEKLTDWDQRIVVNVGLIEGGSARQVLAEHASAWLDLRAPTEEQAEDILQKVRDILNTEHVPGTSASISGRWTRPPSPQTAADRVLFDETAEVARSLGIELQAYTTQAGGDGSYTSVLGIPTLDGFGPASDEVVSAREYILIGSLVTRAALFTLLLDRLGREELTPIPSA